MTNKQRGRERSQISTAIPTAIPSNNLISSALCALTPLRHGPAYFFAYHEDLLKDQMDAKRPRSCKSFSSQEIAHD